MAWFDPFESPLLEGRLVRRYKRFLADIELEGGRAVTAHCPNSGSMLGLRGPGSPVMVRHVPDPKRKLRWTWELVSPDAGRTWVGINTMRPNQVVEHLVAAGAVPGLDPSAGLRREVRYGVGSRIDLLLGDPTEGPGRATYVEVKNTTLAYRTPIADIGGPDVPEGDRGEGDAASGRAGAMADASVGGRSEETPAANCRKTSAAKGGGAPPSRVATGPGPHTAVFPDAVTTRGAKHMRELAAMVAEGHDAAVVFFVNRADCDRFDVADDIDPAYGAALRNAVEAGVRVVPLGMEVTRAGWRLRGVLPATRPWLAKAVAGTVPSAGATA